MRKIPKTVLADIDTVYPRDHEAAFGGVYAEKGVELTHVNFDTRASLAPKAYQLGSDTKGVLYVCAANTLVKTGAEPRKAGDSLPVNTGDKITVNGAYTGVIAAVHAYKEFSGRMHHWEIEVAG